MHKEKVKTNDTEEQHASYYHDMAVPEYHLEVPIFHSKVTAEPHGLFTNRYRDTYIQSSRVKGARQSNVPGPLSSFVGSVHLALPWFLRIYKIVCIIVQGLAHDKRSLPWG